MTTNGKYEDTANVLIFVALAEEYDELLAALPPIADHSNELHVISEHHCDVSGYRVFSVLSVEMGDASASNAVEAAINLLSPNLIVCVGIAGSLTNDLKIGDVAVSNEIIDISQNIKISERVIKGKKRTRRGLPAKTSERREQHIELSPKPFSVPAELTATFRFIRSHPTLKINHAAWIEEAQERRECLEEEIRLAGLVDELQVDPSVEIGTIVSGPVVASSAFRQTLKGLDRKVLAVETESAGVFRAAAKARVPCTTIRGISDHADLGKNALERTTKKNARKLAAVNAIEYLKIQLRNPSFMNFAKSNHVTEGIEFKNILSGPDSVFKKVINDIDGYLLTMSPEYKHRPNNANLPIPRVRKEVFKNKIDDEDNLQPRDILDALRGQRRLYIRIPKSFPNQTLAWSIGQALLRGDIDGKQILPLVVAGDEIIPPAKGISHATGIDCSASIIRDNFEPVVIISEPAFHSSARLDFLIEQLKAHTGSIVVISRAESPPAAIDRMKADLALVDHATAPVPFKEIANYLEVAFDMRPDQADSVAMRLDDTFSKFRLHTHPAYFVGLQEATIEALIQAN